MNLSLITDNVNIMKKELTADEPRWRFISEENWRRIVDHCQNALREFSLAESLLLQRTGAR